MSIFKKLKKVAKVATKTSPINSALVSVYSPALQVAALAPENPKIAIAIAKTTLAASVAGAATVAVGALGGTAAGAEVKKAVDTATEEKNKIVAMLPDPVKKTIAPPQDFLAQIKADVAGIVTPGDKTIYNGIAAATPGLPTTYETDFLEKFFAWLAGILRG